MNNGLKINLKNDFYNSKNYFVEYELELDAENLGTSFFEKIKNLQISKIHYLFQMTIEKEER